MKTIRIHTWIKALLAVMIGVLIGGCGGGGSTSSTEVQITTNASTIAYQKDDAWMDDLTPTETLANGEKRYSFEANGNYGVAIYCNNDKHLIIFQMSTEESRKVHFSCDRLSKLSDIKGTVNDPIETPGGFAVAMERRYDIPGPNGKYNIQGVPLGKRDLIAVSLKSVNSKTVPQHFYVERDIPIQTNSQTIDITFTSTNTCGVDDYSFIAQNGTQAEAYLITKNETFFTSAIDDKWYVPKEKLLDDDFYAFYASKVANKVISLEVTKATVVAKEDKFFDVSYIQQFMGATYDKNSAIFTGLGYQPSAQSQPLKTYIAMLGKTQGNEHIDLILSKEWLNDNTTYTIPPVLQTLNGFQNAWLGVQPDHADISALMSNKSIGQMLSSTKIFTPHDVNLFLLPGVKYEIAIDEIF